MATNFICLVVRHLSSQMNWPVKVAGVSQSVEIYSPQSNGSEVAAPALVNNIASSP